jgi:FKBP-type peptidyl-prolyl cis-trans isomerase FklB
MKYSQKIIKLVKPRTACSRAMAKSTKRWWKLVGRPAVYARAGCVRRSISHGMLRAAPVKWPVCNFGPGRILNKQEEYLMRLIFALIVLAVMATPAIAQDLTTDKGKLSYAIGWDIGEDIQRRGAEFDVETIIAAIRDSSAEKDPQVPAEEMVALLTELQQKVRQEQAEAFQKLADENQAAADEFLEKNLSKNGIVALPSGVQYRIIDEGDGARPGMESTVKVHYRGSKIDGLEFDSSFARGVPEEFPVSTVLKGWQEVLPLMKTGATWQIFVPPELAFGARGNPPVGPNEALMFDLKLVEIVE